MEWTNHGEATIPYMTTGMRYKQERVALRPCPFPASDTAAPESDADKRRKMKGTPCITLYL